MDYSPSEKMALEQARRSALMKDEMRQFSVAATNGQGNRKQRRQMQAELKKMMRKR